VTNAVHDKVNRFKYRRRRNAKDEEKAQAQGVEGGGTGVSAGESRSSGSSSSVVASHGDGARPRDGQRAVAREGEEGEEEEEEEEQPQMSVLATIVGYQSVSLYLSSPGRGLLEPNSYCSVNIPTAPKT
jgi:hypothetical protein